MTDFADAPIKPETPGAGSNPAAVAYRLMPVLLLGLGGSYSAESATELAESLGGSYVRQADVMKSEIIVGSAEGKEVERRIMSGSAVPAELVAKVLRRALDGMPPPQLLEGFPRTLEHLEAFESLVAPCLYAIQFDTDADDLIAALEERGADPHRGWERKLAFVEGQTLPMIGALEARGLLTRVVEPDAMGSAEEAVRSAMARQGAEAAVGRATARPSKAEQPSEAEVSQREEARRAATVLQAAARGNEARMALAVETRAVTRFQAIIRGTLARRALEAARPENISKAIVIRADHATYSDESLESGVPFEADLSSITKVARNDLGLFKQPPAPTFKTAIVQVYVRGARFGGADKSSNGHRFDTVTLANGLIRAGLSCAPIHYLHEEHYKFIATCKGFDALLLRVCPGHVELDGGSQARFDDAMRQLQREKHVMVWPSPDEGRLPDPILKAFREPKSSAGLLGSGKRQASHHLDAILTPVIAEDPFLGPGLSQCMHACCSNETPRASWIDVSEEDMMDALRCGSRIGQAALELLSEARLARREARHTGGTG